MKPPRTELVLSRCPDCRIGLFIVRSLAYTLRTPPVISLPIVTPPCPAAKEEFWMTMFWLGTFTRRPSVLRPDLIATQSSPTLKVIASISTPSQHSGSQPSVLGPVDCTVTPSMVTCVQRVG